MSFTCPVCKYGKLRRPPTDYSSCPCCGTEFGSSDVGMSYEELRELWIEQGALWRSTYVSQPVGWSAFAQMRDGGLEISEDRLTRNSQSDRKPDGIPVG